MLEKPPMLVTTKDGQKPKRKVNFLNLAESEGELLKLQGLEVGKDMLLERKESYECQTHVLLSSPHEGFCQSKGYA